MRNLANLRNFTISALVALLAPAVASAEGFGGITREMCASPAVTASSAYTAGNQVGALVTLSPAFRAVTMGGASDTGGIVQSIRLNMKTVQTAGFKAYQFTGLPTSTLTDKTTPSINVTDEVMVRPPISLASSDSGLGTMTVYGADAIGRAHTGVGQADYWLIVTTGTPTFGSTSDVQFCVTYLLD